MMPCLRAALRPALALRSGVRRGALRGRGPGPGPGAGLLQAAGMGAHPLKEPMEPLTSPQGARDFIYSLQPTERTCLLRELHRFESIAVVQEQLEMAPPTAAQLRYVLFHNALPFIGFGFLDNAIMIVAGTQIELSIGVVLGISTMAGMWRFFCMHSQLVLIHSNKSLESISANCSVKANHVTFLLPTLAAGLGNLVSDLAGLGLAGYVEALACRLGMQIPDLSPKQVDMWQTRLSSHSGKAIGVVIGCLLGMFPLLFFKDDTENKPEPSEGTPPSTDSKK
uniref:Transmembrane protein 65 n=1 Tax=Denticeps clupeoides TaxID=299321 RepID=A0AAY4ATU5_9TELE